MKHMLTPTTALVVMAATACPGQAGGPAVMGGAYGKAMSSLCQALRGQDRHQGHVADADNPATP